MNRRLDTECAIRAPRGIEISAGSWLTDAPLRMLMNNLDPDVAERLSEFVVGIGYSQQAGMVIVAGGTPKAARRIEPVPWNDPASRLMRHADAGYQFAISCAHDDGLDPPSLAL